MRTSVVVIASALLATAAALMWSAFGTTPGKDGRLQAVDAKVAPDADAFAAPAQAAVDAEAAGKTVAAGPRPSPTGRHPAAADQYEAFQALSRSADGDDLFVAASILHDCYFDTRATYQVGTAIAGKPLQSFEFIEADGSLKATLAPATPGQVDAARELLTRCAGFRTTTLASYRSMRTGLSESLLRNDSPIGEAQAIASQRTPATPDRLRAILASRDPMAILLIDGELAARWQSHSAGPAVPGILGAPSPALQLVACDLGMDCSASSRLALTGCLDRAAGCGLDVTAQLYRAASPASASTIERLHDRFLKALVSGDYAIWGL